MRNHLSYGASTEPTSEQLAVLVVVEKNDDPREPDDHALGRSRGGWGTKIHILCDTEGHPLHFHLSPGQTHESCVLEEVLVGADEVLYDEDGVRMAWPLALAGDKAYRAQWIDELLVDMSIKPVIPSKKGEDPQSRHVTFDEAAYRQRNIVERLIGWLKESRRIATRFEKTALNYAGMIKLAFIHRYLRLLTS